MIILTGMSQIRRFDNGNIETYLEFNEGIIRLKVATDALQNFLKQLAENNLLNPLDTEETPLPKSTEEFSEMGIEQA